MKNSGKQLNKILNTYLKALFIMALSSVLSLSFAKSIEVKTDRQKVEMGDVITLLIQTDFKPSSGVLDLSVLEDQFEVLGTQQSHQIEMINGDFRSFTQWQIQLLPKQIGSLMIPPFSLDGVSSKPYPISVSKVQYSQGNAPYFFQASVDKTELYVQEQLIYTLRFFHKGSLMGGNIRHPQFKNALVEQIKEQSIYGKTINNQTYTVYEWQYAVFPQSSGNLEINTPSFSGILQLRSGQKRINAVADLVEVKVLPALDVVKLGQSKWLPAQALSLTEKWHKLPDTIHIGDSLKRTITLEVEGLMATQLPEISVNNGANYKLYQDKPIVEQFKTANGINSRITFTQAVVPMAKGDLKLPDIEIKWWNTKAQHIQSTVLKAQTLRIWPTSSAIPAIANGTSAAPKLTTDGVNNPQLNQNANAYQTPNLNLNQGYENTIWFYLTLLMVVIWLITMVLLFKLKASVKALQNTADKSISPTLIKTVGFNKDWCSLPVNEFYAELLRMLKEDFNIESVNDIENPQLRQAIYQLESHLFAEKALNDRTMQIICDNWAALVKRHNNANKANENNTAKAKKGKLTPLYGKAKT